MLTEELVSTQKNSPVVRVLILCILAITVFISCGGKEQEYVNIDYDKNIVPTVSDDSVTMLISDSGIVRYKLITQEWHMFEQAQEPYWFFPKKFYAEQFDTTFNKQASIRSDTAWYFNQKRLWRLKGNVYMENIKGETFKTEELFWDERKELIYSDKFIEVIQPNKIIQRGKGFESKTNMTEYKIFRPVDSYFYIDEEGKQRIPDESQQEQEEDL